MKSYLYALIAIVLWSSLALLGTNLTNVPPFLLVGLALVIGSVCGLPWIKEWRVSKATLLLGIYGLFSYHFFLFMAFRYAPPVQANLINYLWPLLIVLMSPLFLKNFPLKTHHVVGGLMGFFGALIIVTGGKLSFSTHGLLGYGFAALAAFVWASYSLLSKRVQPFSTGAVGLFCLVSGVLSLICHFIFEQSYSLSSSEYVPLILMGIGPMGLAFFAWDKSLKTGDPRIIGSLSYLTPLLSTLLLVNFGGGQMNWLTELAIAFILLGAVIGTFAGRPQKS